MRQRLALSVVAIGFIAAPAYAGVVVTSTHSYPGDGNKKPEPVMGYFEADRMKMVMPDTTIIFRGDLNKFWVINTPKNNYVEMTPDTMKAMAGQMQAAQAQLGARMAQMQEQLAKLPPEQRAMIEKQLAQQGIGIPGGAAPQPKPAPSYVKSGPAKAVPSGRCELYSRMEGQSKNQDLCIAPIASVGLTQADFKVLDSFSAFAAPMTNSQYAPTSSVFLEWNQMNKAIGFSGIPLETTTFSGGKPEMVDTIQKIEHSAIPTAAFELPQGLAKQEIPLGPPGRGGR
jgi:hypothetical protein